jgi:hypothetical protein
MKASELRIGNWVEVEGFCCTVSELNITDVTITNHVAYENDVFCLLGNGVEPIPLTEEWLLKFGFVKDAQIFDIQYYEKQFLKAATLSIQLCNGICEKRNAGIGYDLEWIFIGDIIYVHQLQNLYHALTGKELTI